MQYDRMANTRSYQGARLIYVRIAFDHAKSTHRLRNGEKPSPGFSCESHGHAPWFYRGLANFTGTRPVEISAAHGAPRPFKNQLKSPGCKRLSWLESLSATGAKNYHKHLRNTDQECTG